MNDQSQEKSQKKIHLRKYAKPKTSQIQNQIGSHSMSQENPINPEMDVQNVLPPSVEPTESDEDMKELYTRIKSIPNYSAKLAEFLRKNEVHSKHRRIVKRKFPRRHIIVHFPFQIFMQYSIPSV